MDLIAGRYEPFTGDDGAVRNPARDIVSGRLVTVLRAPAPGDPLTRFQELDRLRRYAAVRRPHLAAVLTVDLRDGEFAVVCEPLGGTVLDAGAPPAGLTVTAVRSIATQLLDAVASLRLTGVVQGWLRPDVVLLRADPAAPSEPRVTVLPAPLTGGPVPPAGGGADDDAREAATFLLRLLRRVPAVAADDEARARDLARALERVGGTPEQPWGPPEHELFPPPASALAPSPATLSLSPDALVRSPAAAAAPESPGPESTASPATVPTARPPVPAPVARPGLRTRRPRRTRVLAASAVVVLAATAAGLVLAGALRGGSPRAVPAPAATTTSASPSGAPETAGTPTSAPWDVPVTVAGLIDALAAHPEAGGPSGAALLDSLRRVASGDPALFQPAALQLMSLVLDDPGVDPRFAAASVVALATGPVPGNPPSCFGVTPVPPDPVVQRYAQRVLDRLASWQAAGLPTEQADRLRGLADPVAAGQAVPVMNPCPVG